MAGDWIKMRGNLWDDPRVSRLCDLTDNSEAAIVGGLYWLWATADQHTEDGCMPGLTLRQIDRKTGIKGFGDALISIGWLVDDEQGVIVAKFSEHNGTSAKRRCTDAQRKANNRTSSASNADITPTEAGHAEDEMRRLADLEKEKRREEKSREELSNQTQSPRKRRAPASLDVISIEQLIEEGVEKQHAKDWLVVRAKKKAPLTLTAWTEVKAQALLAGVSLDAAVKTSAVNGWSGFKSTWLTADAEAKRGTAANQANFSTAAERRADHISDLVGDTKENDENHKSNPRHNDDAIDVSSRVVDDLAPGA